MLVEIIEEPMARVAELARVPIAFEVTSVLVPALQGQGLGGLLLTECALDRPYVKDYDAFAEEGPATWVRRFDVSKWGFLGAHSEVGRVGGAVLAFDTEGVDMLEGRSDLAVLWDIRVAPSVRGCGIGSALFRAAEAWAVARGCRHLKVETQNTNVAACRFYARQGCVLGAFHCFAYPALPDEIQLRWYRQLSRAR